MMMRFFLYRNYENLENECKHCGKGKVQIKNSVSWLERIATKKI